MTEEGRRFVAIALLIVLLIAGDVAAVVIGGRAGLAIGLVSNAVLVVAMIVTAFWMVRHPRPHAAPDSRIARFERWVQKDSAEPPARYCAHCGRRRMRVTPFDYSPPTAAEQQKFCTPLSCEWFDEPSLAEPPPGTGAKSDPRQYRPLLWRPHEE